jgi:hypothetical protein
MVYDYVAERYEKELGQTLAKAGEGRGVTPSWELVSAADLRSPAASKPEAGALVDPEIALRLFLVPFASGDRLDRQVEAALALDAPKPGTQHLTPSLLWLVEESVRAEWQAQVVQLRHQSRVSEELALDAVFYAPEQLESALAAHGLPCLLLVSRHVLTKAAPADVANWMNADRAVVLELEDFPERFSEPEQRQRAQVVQDHLSELVLAAKSESVAPPAPKALKSLQVENFRNLRQVQLDFGPAPVSCWVIQGPNGTGKSSLCEALSLAFSGSSARYRQFLARDERDVTGSDRRRAYTEKYLAPTGQPELQPCLGLNGQSPTPPALVDSWDEANRVESELSGSLLSQEACREFSQVSADQLALRVLTGYSELAERLEAFVEERMDLSQQGRQSFLRNLGISSQITKLASALERIVEQVLAREWPQASPALLDWLAQLAQHPATAVETGSLLAEWRQWNSPEARKGLTATLSNSSEEAMAAVLRDAFQSGKTLRSRTGKACDLLTARLAPFGEHLHDTLRELASWGEWLQSRDGVSSAQPGSQPASSAGKVSAPASSGQLSLDTQGLNLALAPAQLRQQLDEAQKAQLKVTRAGQTAKQHLDHLEQAAAFLARGWTAHQESQCPTCGAEDTTKGGIEKVVADYRAKIAQACEQLVREYKALGDKVAGLQRALQEKGETPYPISEERQAMLREALAWACGVGQPLEAQLKEPAQRSRLLGLLQKLQSPPPLPSELNAAQEAQRCAASLAARVEDARAIFHDPDHWKPVQAAFVKKLAKVMADHLPGTLQRLWAELTLNLTAAPWLLPQRPAFDVVNKRGARRVSVCVEERLARYILNQAETHTLGLGWFFTRYFTHGRFRGHFMIMDDPAPHLDGTSFNALSRLWQALVRLHETRQIPFRLVVFLADKERAMEATRAAGGTLALLGWQPEQVGGLQEAQVPPAPAVH